MLSSPVYAELHPRPSVSPARLSSISFCPSQRSNVQMRLLHPEWFCGTFQRANDLASNSFAHTFLATPHPLTPLLSHSYKNHRGAPPIFSFALGSLFALFDQRVFHNSFPIKRFRTLSQNCRGVYPPSSPFWFTWLAPSLVGNSEGSASEGNPPVCSEKQIPPLWSVPQNQSSRTRTTRMTRRMGS